MPKTPAVRCACCRDIYCVDVGVREYNTGYIAVPEGAKNWLCPKCRGILIADTRNRGKSADSADEVFRSMVKSQMNVRLDKVFERCC